VRRRRLCDRLPIVKSEGIHGGKSSTKAAKVGSRGVGKGKKYNKKRNI
jgi:hypothetical protein